MATSELDAWLTEWRQTFDPTLGLLIERLGASQSVPLEPLPIKKRDRAAALAALAQSSTSQQRSAVLAAFEDFAREAPNGLVWPSIEAWATIDPDPRVARMALRVLAADKSLGKFWRRLVGCLEQHGDSGIAAEARSYEQRLQDNQAWSSAVTRFSNVLRKLQRTRPAPASPKPAWAKRLASLQQPATAPLDTRDGDALLKAIIAQPEAVEPRQVYADWLLEQQLPQGEFIALQLQPQRTPATRAREKELLANHRSTFLGPFKAEVQLTGLRFERGFLSSARFKHDVPAHLLTALLHHVEFEAGFKPGARFESLTSAVGPFGKDFAALATGAPRLRDWSVPGEPWLALLEALERVQLEALTIKSLRAPRLDRALAEIFKRQTRLSALSIDFDKGGSPHVDLSAAPPSLTSLTVVTRAIHATFTRTTHWGVVLKVSFQTPQAFEAALSALVGDGSSFEPLVAELVGNRKAQFVGELEPVLNRLVKQTFRFSAARQ